MWRAALRFAGNAALKAGKRDVALDRYDESLAVRPHHFTLANAALVHLQIAQAAMATCDFMTAMNSTGAAQDYAGKAAQLEPSYGKGHYRFVKSYLLSRDFPRARMFAERGLQSISTDDTAYAPLTAIRDTLVEAGVGERFASGMSDQAARNQQLKHSGAECRPCEYCYRQVAMRFWRGDFCPVCGCNPHDERGQLLGDDVLAGL